MATISQQQRYVSLLKRSGEVAPGGAESAPTRGAEPSPTVAAANKHTSKMFARLLDQKRLFAWVDFMQLAGHGEPVHFFEFHSELYRDNNASRLASVAEIEEFYDECETKVRDKNSAFDFDALPANRRKRSEEFDEVLRAYREVYEKAKSRMVSMLDRDEASDDEAP